MVIPTRRPADKRDHHAVAPTTFVTTSRRSEGAAAEIHTDGAGAAGGDAPLRVGGFRFWFVGQRWEWSDEVCRMHGYQPGVVVPTTKLVLSHKHPDDRSAVQDLLDQALHSGGSFSSRHRFHDTAGNEHSVIVVADRMLDEAGAVVGTTGYYIDVTDTLDENRRKVLDETLPKVIEARAVIEQAKGALRLVYGIGAEQAFNLLRWRSQETNTKVRALAAQLLAELDSLASASAGLRSQFDHLFLTVHQRIPVDHASS
jgi:PAS domain S-box-containing protein